MDVASPGRALAVCLICEQDWNDGRIPYYTSPPSRGNQEFAAAEVVGSWAKEFNADEVRACRALCSYRRAGGAGGWRLHQRAARWLPARPPAVQVFAAERSAVIAHLPSMEDDAAPAFFEAASAGAARLAPGVLMEEDDDDGQGGAQQQQGSGDEDEEEEDGGPVDMEDDEEYGAHVAKRAKGAGGAAAAAGKVQAELLYAEAGQFNPHAARQQRKKAKKEAVKAPPPQEPAPGKGAWRLAVCCGNGGGPDAAWHRAVRLKRLCTCRCCCSRRQEGRRQGGGGETEAARRRGRARLQLRRHERVAHRVTSSAPSG